MKNTTISISETELDILRQAMSILKSEIEDDRSGIIKRNMPKLEQRQKYIDAVTKVYNRFLKIEIE